MEELKFKTKKAEETYQRVSGILYNILYEWANNAYYDLDNYSLVSKYMKLLNIKVSQDKAYNKLCRIFEGAHYAFDLPEHPEKHNGYYQSWQYLPKVMQVFGFDFTASIKITEENWELKQKLGLEAGEAPEEDF